MHGISFFKSSGHKSNLKKISGSFMLHKESSETEMNQDTSLASNLAAKHLDSILDFNSVNTSSDGSMCIEVHDGCLPGYFSTRILKATIIVSYCLLNS